MTGPRKVFADGAFDLLHPNHVRFLETARSYGDYLVVGVLSDDIVASYKRAPVMRQDERLAMIRALTVVDEAFIVHGSLSPQLLEDIIQRHGISAVVYAGHATPELYGPAERRGIMIRPAYQPGICTTVLLERIFARADLRPEG